MFTILLLSTLFVVPWKGLMVIFSIIIIFYVIHSATRSDRLIVAYSFECILQTDVYNISIKHGNIINVWSRNCRSLAFARIHKLAFYYGLLCFL